MEKYFIRKAFEDILPEEITWRRKEAFSDGISATTKSWYQIIQEHTKTKFNLDEKEFYKLKFIEYFSEKNLNIIPEYWQPKFTGTTEYVDPSARILNNYLQ